MYPGFFDIKNPISKIEISYDSSGPEPRGQRSTNWGKPLRALCIDTKLFSLMYYLDTGIRYVQESVVQELLQSHGPSDVRG